MAAGPSESYYPGPNLRNTPSMSTVDDIVEEKQQAAVTVEEEKLIPMSTMSRVFIIFTLGLAVFIASLDSTVVSTLVPTLVNEFHSVQAVGWFGSVYLLVTGATQPSLGKLYVTFPPKIVLLCSVAMLEVGSLICALSHSAQAFICGRAIAGLGCSGIMSGAMIIITLITPLAQRPMYMGIIGALESVALIVGPLIGGAITTNIGWQWCFWINIPIGVVFCIVLSVLFNPPAKPQTSTFEKSRTESFLEKLGQVDFVGGLGIAGSLTCLLLALQWGGIAYPWYNVRIIALLVTFAVTFVLVGFHQRWRGEKATFPTRLLKNKSFSAYLMSGFCIAGSQFVVLYYLAVWFQAIQGVSAAQSGVRTLPLVISVIVTALIAGGGSSGIGYLPPFIMLATVLSTCGAGMLSTLHPGIAKHAWIGYQILYASGSGMAVQQTIIGVQTSVASSDVAYASSAIMLANTIGGAIWICVAQNLFLLDTANMAKKLPNIDQSVLLSGFARVKSLLTPEEWKIALDGYNAGIQRVFILVIVLCALTVLAWPFYSWESIKGKMPQPGGGPPPPKKDEETGRLPTPREAPAGVELRQL